MSDENTKKKGAPRPKGKRTKAKTKSMTGEMMAMLPKEVREALPVIGIVTAVGVTLFILGRATAPAAPVKAGEVAEKPQSLVKQARGWIWKNKAPLGALGGGLMLGGFVHEKNRLLGAGIGGLLGGMAYGLYSLTLDPEPKADAAAEPAQIEEAAVVEAPAAKAPNPSGARTRFVQRMNAERPDAKVRLIGGGAADVYYANDPGKNAELTDIQTAQKVAQDFGVMLDTIRKQPDGAFRFRFQTHGEMSAEPAAQARRNGSGVRDRLARVQRPTRQQARQRNQQIEEDLDELEGRVRPATAGFGARRSGSVPGLLSQAAVETDGLALNRPRPAPEFRAAYLSAR